MTPPAAVAAAGRRPQGVVLLLCIVSFLLILLLASHSPRLEPQGGSRHHRRLKLHPRTSKSASSSGAVPVVDGGQQQQHQHQHHHHAFDPVIAEVEHRLEDKEWEREHYRLLHDGDGDGGPDEHMKEWEEFLKEEEDLINDDDRFNLDDRIRSLFPKIDIAPQDGFVSVDELSKWNLDQAKADQLHRSGREMELYDKNGDGIISFEDFKERRDVSRRQSNLSEFPWWNEEHFNASDANGDGFLDKAEFNDFLNPSDSENSKIINLLCKQEISLTDKDGDRKLNFEEYFNGLHDHMHDYDDEHADISHIGNITAAKERFSKLDKDNDGFISEHELEPAIDKLHLTESSYARQQAVHSISEADKNHDGRVTLKEMMENPYAFYVSIYSTDDEDYFHDEFR